MMGMRPIRIAPALFLPLRITTSLPLQGGSGCTERNRKGSDVEKRA